MIGYTPYKTYKSKVEARNVATRLRKQGRGVTIREVALKNKGIRYRLFVR